MKHPTVTTRTAELLELRRDMERRARDTRRKLLYEREPLSRARLEGYLSALYSDRIKLREVIARGVFSHGWR